MCRYVKEHLQKASPSYKPKLAVILPCKGLDPGFAGNLQKLLSQDYKFDGKSHFEVIFAVAKEEDEAYPFLLEASRAHPEVKSQVVVAGITQMRAQKINNQIEALKYVSSDVEVLAFVDSDVIARPDFLSYLVGSLNEPGVGATTGYRFYVPEKGEAASMLRSIWNRMSAWEMASPKYAFAWGGAMAIKRSVFEKAQVLSHWDKAADDDLSLTVAVKDLGLKVMFIPQCLVASHGDGDWPEVVEWTNRQLILTKVYYPALWRRSIYRAAIMATWLFAVLATFILYLASGEEVYFHSLLVGLAILPVEVYFLLKGQELWQQVLSDRRQELAGSLPKFLLAIPLAHLTLPFMTLYSLCTNRIRWRGINYELKSPSETLIV